MVHSKALRGYPKELAQTLTFGSSSVNYTSEKQKLLIFELYTTFCYVKCNLQQQCVTVIFHLDCKNHVMC